jgi:hypothetical protein
MRAAPVIARCGPLLYRARKAPLADSALIVINRIRPGWGHGRKSPFALHISYDS